MLTEEIKKSCINDYLNGELCKSIAEKYKIGRSTLSKLLNENKIERRGTRQIIKESEYQNIKRLYEQGLSLAEIGKKYNCSYGPIRDTLNKIGVTIRGKRKDDNDLIYTPIAEAKPKNVHTQYLDKFTIGQVVKTTEGKGIITERNKDNFLVQFKNYAESFTLWQLWKANYSVGGAE